MENKEFKDAKVVGERSTMFIVAISIFFVAWIAVLSISIIFLMQNTLFILLALVSVAMIVFCVLKGVDYVFTPKTCIKCSAEKIFFWFNRKWYSMNLSALGTIKTGNDAAGSVFNTLNSILNRGTVTLCGRNGSEYKVRFVKSPDKVKEELESYLNLL